MWTPFVNDFDRFFTADGRLNLESAFDKRVTQFVRDKLSFLSEKYTRFRGLSRRGQKASKWRAGDERVYSVLSEIKWRRVSFDAMHNQRRAA